MPSSSPMAPVAGTRSPTEVAAQPYMPRRYLPSSVDLGFVLALFAIREYNKNMILKPQDVVVVVKLCLIAQEPWTYQQLSAQLFLSSSEVHSAVRRAVAARLISDVHTGTGRPIRPAVVEFLLHGVQYAYPPQYGGLTRGTPTAYAAPPLNKLVVGSNEPPPVWPYEEGAVRGIAFEPLYPSVPKAAAHDGNLYEALALVDAMRAGRSRERQLAASELKSRLTAPRHV